MKRKNIYLQVGDELRETDKMLHRGKWYPVKDCMIHGTYWMEGMKKMKRTDEKEIKP